MTQQRDLLEINDVTIDERTALVQLLQRYSQDEVKSDEKRSVIGLAGLGATITWILNHREDIKKALALAEDLIAWVKKWRERRAAEAATPLPAATQQQPAAPQQARIVLVLAGDGPRDITSATDEEIRRYFGKGPSNR